MKSWFDFPQIWATTACTTTTYTTTTSQETEDYNHFYYNYIPEYKYIQDIQDFNGLFSSSISTAEVNGLFDCSNPIEITTPIKKHGVKMG